MKLQFLLWKISKVTSSKFCDGLVAHNFKLEANNTSLRISSLFTMVSILPIFLMAFALLSAANHAEASDDYGIISPNVLGLTSNVEEMNMEEYPFSPRPRSRNVLDCNIPDPFPARSTLSFSVMSFRPLTTWGARRIMTQPHLWIGLVFVMTLSQWMPTFALLQIKSRTSALILGLT
mgnify:CR=1 FL=1